MAFDILIFIDKFNVLIVTNNYLFLKLLGCIDGFVTIFLLFESSKALFSDLIFVFSVHFDYLKLYCVI